MPMKNSSASISSAGSRHLLGETSSSAGSHQNSTTTRTARFQGLCAIFMTSLVRIIPATLLPLLPSPRLCQRTGESSTIIDTDVAYGSGVGLVAMIEVAALRVDNITQGYCEVQYKQPQQIMAGMFLKVGQPKSLFRPGSSTVVLLLQAGRVQFAPDLLSNQAGPGISVFSQGFHRPLVETEVRVRSSIATQSRLTS